MDRRSLVLVVGGVIAAGALVRVLLDPGARTDTAEVARAQRAAPLAPEESPVVLVETHERRTGELEATVEEASIEAPAPEPLREDDLASLLRRVRPEALEGLSAAELIALEELDLRGKEITDDDLRLIGQLTNLKTLSLYGAPVTDAGLEHLAGLHELESLVLRGTQVTGTGLRHLPTETLVSLHLCGSKITENDLRYTPAMPSLEQLKLNFLELEDTAVELLSVYPSLKHVELDQSRMTDAGLERLMQLNPGLTRVEVRNTQISSNGLRRIAELYPGCEFVTQSGTLAFHR
ncbi:MAG: hypothetical protein AAGB93_01320 [Planctomycetota bacterium]